MKEIPLGYRVKDIITGFTGIVTAHCLYLDGSEQYAVTPTGNASDRNPKGDYIDGIRLEIVDEGIHIVPARHAFGFNKGEHTNG